MSSAKRSCVLLIECLHPNAEPIDSSDSHVFQALRADGTWIGLEGDLGVRIEREHIQNSLDDPGRGQGGRASTKIHTVCFAIELLSHA